MENFRGETNKHNVQKPSGSHPLSQSELYHVS